MNLKISFVIPCYNAEKYIQRCIESIQTTSSHEIIVVNDGSRDKTEQIVQQLMQRCTNIRLLNKDNQGVNAARRDGYKVAIGEYICFVDADDTVSLSKELLSWLDKDYDVIKAGGYYEKGENKEIYSNKYIGTIKDAEHAYCLMLDGQLLPYIHSTFFKRKAVDENCFQIDSRFKIGEDLLFNIRIMGEAKRMVSVENAFYHYVMNENSVMHTNIWGFNYIRDFNTALASQILKQSPCLERKIIEHRFLDYTGTLLFPEISYKKEYYHEINQLLKQHPEIKNNAPKKQTLFIGCEPLYRVYICLFHLLQRLRGKGMRKVID